MQLTQSDEVSADSASSECERARLRATAFHEAGHAVMAVSLGRTIQKVTIRAGKSPFGMMRLGVCELKKGRTRSSGDPLEDDAMILFAGMVAESRFTGRYCEQGASQDLLHIRQLLARRARTERQFDKLHRRILDKTEHVLHDPAHDAAVKSLAEQLLEKTTISGRAVRHIFEQSVASLS